MTAYKKQIPSMSIITLKRITRVCKFYLNKNEKGKKEEKEAINETLTIKSSILTERQKIIIETIRMRLTGQQSLEYLSDVGFPCSTATFYREKKKVEEMKQEVISHCFQWFCRSAFR